MPEAGGYVLRITTPEWVRQVFDTLTYCTNLSRRWEPGQTILFVHKTHAGEAVVGFGIVEAIREKDELSEDERGICEKGGWKKAILFKYVKEFGQPLLIKKTCLKDLNLHGKYFHGLKVAQK